MRVRTSVWMAVAVAVMPLAVAAAEKQGNNTQIFVEPSGKSAFVVGGKLVGTAASFTAPKGAKLVRVTSDDYRTKPPLIALLNPRMIRADSDPDDPDESPNTPDHPSPPPRPDPVPSDTPHPEPKPDSPHDPLTDPPPKDPNVPLPTPGCTGVPGCFPGIFRNRDRVTHYFPEIRRADVFKVKSGTVAQIERAARR